MKKQTLKPNLQQSQSSPHIDISKYKFIPSAKLLKSKNNNNNNHSRSLAQSSINQQSILPDQPIPNANTIFRGNQKNSYVSVNGGISGNIGNGSGNNKQNQCKVVSTNKQSKMFRSISNPKLQKSTSRHTVLPQKNPPYQTYKQQQQHLQNLAQFIQQLQSKHSQKNSQLANLKQQNKSLNQKLQKTYHTLQIKNKQISQLTLKIKCMENQMKQKLQQNALIIDSLKKVVESQSNKIQEARNRYNKIVKIRNVINNSHHNNNTNRHIKTEMYQQCQDDYNQQSQRKLRQDKNNINKAQYQQPPLKCKKFLKFIRNSLNQQNNPQPNGINQNEQKYRQTQTSINSNSNSTAKLKISTPDFGQKQARQQYQLQLQSQQQQQLQKQLQQDQQQQQQQQKFSSLQSSLIQENPNLTLSRISQSAEQDFQTSREMVSLQQIQNITNLNNNNNTANIKYNIVKNSTHQQLLDQIDQYLSKKSYVQVRR